MKISSAYAVAFISIAGNKVLGLNPGRCNRRTFFRNAAAAAATSTIVTSSNVANAGIDINALRSLPVEGDNTGVETRLRQIELNKNRPEDTIDVPWTVLEDGVQYRDYRDGKGEVEVSDGSKVGVEMTIRCKSFATAQEPGGLKYFNTKDDTDFNELAFTVGNGEILAQLEEGMKGMKRGSVRRIEIPTQYVYAAKKADQLPLPSEKNKDGKRRFDNLFKTDATLIVEVLVTRIK